MAKFSKEQCLPARVGEAVGDDRPDPDTVALRRRLRQLEKSQQRLARSRHDWVAVFDAVTLPMFSHDTEYRVVRANRAYAARAGLSIPEILGKPYWEAFPRRIGPLHGCTDNTQSGARHDHVEEFTLDSGETFRSHAFPVYADDGAFQYSVHLLEDITAQRRSEAERVVLNHALEQVGEGIVVLHPDLLIRYVNPALCALAGRPLAELLGAPLTVFVPEAERAALMPRVYEALTAHGHWAGEAGLAVADGPVIPVHLTIAALTDARGEVTGFVAAVLDLRAIKQAQARLDIMHGVIEELSAETDFDILGRRALSAARRLCGADFGAIAVLAAEGGQLGYRWHDGTPDTAILAKLMRPFAPGQGIGGLAFQSGRPVIVADYRRFPQALAEYAEIGVRSGLAVPIVSAGRAVGALSLGSLTREAAFAPEQIVLLESVARQIGAALRREQLLKEAGTAAARLQRVVEAVPDILFVIGLPEMVPSFVSPAVHELLGYTPEEVVGDPDLWRRQMHGEDRERVLAELQRAAASGEGVHLVLRFHHKDGQTVRWFDGRSTVVRDAHGRPTGIFGVLTDITWRKHAEAERERHEREQLESARKLESALVQTIEAVALTIEKRDPYTAGHQQRVAELAVAIARELGLDEALIHGLRLGGIIHDIGKISVPAEILNRPGRLSPAEFEIIKSHPQIGYDIIKGVDFPWPVGDMVLQHHERLDGSGYPHGLRGEEIRLEARILAVADVVEAMMSHRPYRPGQGSEAALAEVERQRGTRFDAAAVDACLRLFRERGFRFSDLV